jgi:hypothetical protein
MSTTNLETTSVIICYTNIVCNQGVEAIAPALNAIHGMIRWTIDLSDSDKVLRVVAHFDITATVVDIIQASGFQCLVMPADTH